jgi:hypothetical protein
VSRGRFRAGIATVQTGSVASLRRSPGWVAHDVRLPSLPPAGLAPVFQEAIHVEVSDQRADDALNAKGNFGLLARPIEMAAI